MQAITRAFTILNEVASEGDGVGLAEISTATALPIASCHRLLGGLQDCALVERNPATKRFRPRPALIRLCAAVWSAGPGPLVDARLAELRDRWQECFFIASINGDSIVSTRSVSAVNPDRMSVSVPLGRRMHPHAAASCKAILAYRSPEEREAFISAAGGLPRLTAHTITNRKELNRQLRELPTLGYGVCDQESEAGVSAIAVPIMGVSGEVRASLGVIGPRDRLLESLDKGLVSDMKEAAEALGSLLHESRGQLVPTEGAATRPSSERSLVPTAPGAD